MTQDTPNGKPTQATPIGVRALQILEIAYRATQAVLMEGPTGIGKSELFRQLAKKLRISLVVIDLSLLEPPDLIGLPEKDQGRTVYAIPSILPLHGRGIILLEELNRAPLCVRQPALQLLTERKLHDYQVPDGYIISSTASSCRARSVPQRRMRSSESKCCAGRNRRNSGARRFPAP